MKVTVAFGDVKVVVPCGHGDITIRQLSELAVTRYLKSIQQEKKSQRMFVNINALVLARDFGILDWDDNVSDVVDDRELIIARFQSNSTSYNNTNNSSVIGGSNIACGNNNNHHFCSEWGNCLPVDSDVATSTTSETMAHHLAAPTKTSTTSGDSTENPYRGHCRKNGSLVPVSTNSVDSYNYNWRIPSTNRHLGSEKRHFQKGKYVINKRLSVDEIDSSLWPIPPPIIDPTTSTTTTSENATHSLTPIFSRSIQHNPLSSTYFSYPYSHSLSTDSDVTKKTPLMDVTKSGTRRNSEIMQAPSSLSSSLPSNADAKSMPQSYYSSLESTAVSDGNNSSYDDGQHREFIESSILPKVSLTEQRESDGRSLFLRKKPEFTEISVDKERIVELEINQSLPSNTEPRIESIHCDLSDIQEEDLSTRSKSHQNHETFNPQVLGDPSSSSNRMITSPNLQLPPPMPPLRSAFTKLSPKPLNIAFQSLNLSTVSSSDCHLDADLTSNAQLKLLTELSEIKQQVNLSKSEHSIPSLFDSEVQMMDDIDNEWSTSERSADLDSMATTTETSIHTTTTATNSFNASGRTTDGLVVVLTKSANGFGFSLTSRQNPIDLTNPVYVSKVLENGPAIFDGRMKAGDRILMINDEDVRHLSQKNIKEILLNIPVESTVKIGLCRPNSDAITNFLGASNSSTMQKKISIPSTLNHTGDEVNDECNQISVEEQKPVSFPMCTCSHRHSLPCSKLNLYHFIIPQKVSKSDYLIPHFNDRSTTDTITKSLDIKTEPPAIQLHHQNKLSPSPFSNKQSSDVKPPNATLGISVRRGISQMSFNDSETVCQSACHSQPETCSSSKKKTPETSDKFPANNYYGNFEESSHKFCPNCHGLLSLKHGVFVKAIIIDGAAHMDGRLVNGDEIIAVQGICLYNGEEFIAPNNKVLLGDSYESLKFAQMPSLLQNRIQTFSSSTSSIEPSNKIDPLNLLKQILNHAQCTSNSVSLVILRRSLEKRSCSINTLASVDANCCHNVTVAADVHTQYKREDVRGDILNFVKPHLISSNEPLAISTSNREKIERFEEFRNKDHHQRFYRRDSDNEPERTASTNLICLESENESDDQNVAGSDVNSNPNNSPNNNMSLAESYHVSSGILTDFEVNRVPIAMRNEKSGGSVIDNRVDSLVNFDHSLLSSSFPAPTNSSLGSESHFQPFLSRDDKTRQSFSLKRLHLNNPSTSSRMSRLAMFNTEKPTASKNNVKYNPYLRRPKSEVVLSRVEEEHSLSDLDNNTDFEDRVLTIGRKVTLKRRSVMKKLDFDKEIYEKFMTRTLKAIPSQDD